MPSEQNRENGGGIFFWFCVDVSIVNAFILEKKALNHWTRGQLEFRTELAHDLLGDFSSHTRTVASGQMEEATGLTHSQGDSVNAVLSIKLLNFVQWAASAATNEFVWHAFPTTSVLSELMRHKGVKFKLQTKDWAL